MHMYGRHQIDDPIDPVDRLDRPRAIDRVAGKQHCSRRYISLYTLSKLAVRAPQLNEKGTHQLRCRTATSTPRERRDETTRNLLSSPPIRSITSCSSDPSERKEHVAVKYLHATDQKMPRLLHVLDRSPDSYIYIHLCTYLLTCTTLLAQRKLTYNNRLGNGN